MTNHQSHGRIGAHTVGIKQKRRQTWQEETTEQSMSRYLQQR